MNFVCLNKGEKISKTREYCACILPRNRILFQILDPPKTGYELLSQDSGLLLAQYYPQTEN